jgi:hypothetical protein
MRHAISNVTFYLTNSANASIEVKLDDWDGEIKNSSYPVQLESSVEREISLLTGDNSYEVVGYAIKAGNDIFVKGDQPSGTDLDQSTNDVVFDFDYKTNELTLTENKLSVKVEETNDSTIELNGQATNGTDGDDIFKADDKNDVKSKLIDGKEGTDTIQLDFDDDIDLSKLNLKNFEIIDTKNDFDQKIKIDLDSITDITDSDNDLVFVGNKGDEIKFSSKNGESWTKGDELKTVDGQDGEFTEYVNNEFPNISVLIDNDIDVDLD